MDCLYRSGGVKEASVNVSQAARKFISQAIRHLIRFDPGDLGQQGIG